MKRWIVLVVAVCLGATSTGCTVAPWSPDPVVRAQQLIQQSEQLRQSGQDMGHFLLLDQPSNLNVVRTSGSLGP